MKLLDWLMSLTSPLLLLLLVVVLCAILPQENADWLFLACAIYIMVYFVWLVWKPRGERSRWD